MISTRSELSGDKRPLPLSAHAVEPGFAAESRNNPDTGSQIRPPKWKTLSAFAIVYLVWGSSFLAIRIGVHDVPPFLFAAMRVFVAGLVLYGAMVVHGEKSPTIREWLSVFLLALLIFAFDYGMLFWAEQRVPSGPAAIIMATIPVFMTLSEIFMLHTQKPSLRLGLALLIGIGGVAALTSNSSNLSGAPIDPLGAVALIFASLSWAGASALSRTLPLPGSKIMSSGAQMLAGGILLTLAALASGEFQVFHPGSVSRGAWLSLLYLIVAGSIIGFTAYVWLIGHESPTKVGTYAYVNPVVAVLIGHFLGDEALGVRTVLGATCVLVSVIVITTMKQRTMVGAAKAEDAM